MEDPEIESIVSLLVADYDRQGGELSNEQVNRILSKRNVSVTQSVSIIEKLESLGITPSDGESEIEDFSPGDSFNSSVEQSEYDFAREKELERTTNILAGKLLTAEDEVKLGRIIYLGRLAKEELESGVLETTRHLDLIKQAEEARDTMIKKNLRLVLHIAKPYHGYSDLTIDDLFQEGIFGLIRSVEKFDHTLGYKFSTYSTWWIRQSITRALADKGAIIRLPVHVHSDVWRYFRAKKLIESLNPIRPASISELADELAWSPDKVHFISQVSQLAPTSIDQSITEESDKTIQDQLVSPELPPDGLVEIDSLSSQIRTQIQKLTEREQDIITSRFGLKDQGDGETLEEIGQRHNLTRERIRQIESKVLEKFRKPSMSGPLKEYNEGK